MYKNTLIKLIVYKYLNIKLYAIINIENIMEIKFKLIICEKREEKLEFKSIILINFHLKKKLQYINAKCILYDK